MRASAQSVAQQLRVFNVLDFGAVGDGANDDTVAIQAALTAAAASLVAENAAGRAAQAEVLFPIPRSTYVTTAEVTIRPRQSGISSVSNTLRLVGGFGPASIAQVPIALVSGAASAVSLLRVAGADANTTPLNLELVSLLLNQSGSGSQTGGNALQSTSQAGFRGAGAISVTNCTLFALEAALLATWTSNPVGANLVELVGSQLGSINGRSFDIEHASSVRLQDTRWGGGALPALVLNATTLLIGSGCECSDVYSAGVTYALGEFVAQNGIVYVSLQAGNVGHSPATSPTFWQALDPISTLAGAAMVNPMTTAGDVIVGGAAGAPARLGVGSSSQVIVGGTTPAWAAVPVTGLSTDVTDPTPTGPVVGSTGRTPDAGHQHYTNAIVRPAELGILAWDYDSALISAQPTLTSQTIYFGRVWVPKAITATNILIGVQAAVGTPTACGLALYTGAASPALLSGCGDISTNLGTTGGKVIPLSVAQALAAGTYVVAFWCNATTPAKLYGLNIASAGQLYSGVVAPTAARAGTAQTNQTSATPPANLTGLAYAAAFPWFGID